jgi:pimeloyl-ACP methyl ester carboxylesterase
MSIARTLASQGFEVWTHDTRGSGESVQGPYLDLSKWKFSLDDLIHTDLPAVISYVLSTSGATSYLWLGHSWGGTDILAYLGTHPESPCTGAVLVAPGIVTPYPGWQTDPKRMKLWGWIVPMRKLLAPGLPIPTTVLTQGLAAVLPEGVYSWTAWFLSWFVGEIVWSKENTNNELMVKALQKVVADLNSTQLRQLMDWGAHMDTYTWGPSPYEWQAESSKYYQQNGFQSYAALLPHLKIPQLWIAGPMDYLVPVGMAAQAYALSGATEKTWVEASKSAGFSADYGHGDLLVGLHTPTEIYPIISNWIKAHATPN